MVYNLEWINEVPCRNSNQFPQRQLKSVCLHQVPSGEHAYQHIIALETFDLKN